jgi:ribosome biogenesis protein MAK21
MSIKPKGTVTQPTKDTANVDQQVRSRATEIAVPQSAIDRPLQLSNTSKPDQKTVNQQRLGKLKLEPHPLWYEIERPDVPAKIITPNSEIVAHLQSRGNFLLQSESENYLSSNHVASSDRQFLSTIMTSGTQSDKLSALTLSITSSPIHSRKQLEALLGMAKKKSRNEAVQAIAALKDLLVGNLLPDRKLVFFGKQPRLHSAAKDEELMLWAFEDWLKGWYFQVLQVVEVSKLLDGG